MLRFITLLGGAILAAIGVTFLLESGTSLNATFPTDLAYLRAIHEALMGIGLLLIAIFSALVVIILPDKPRMTLEDLQ